MGRTKALNFGERQALMRSSEAWKRMAIAAAAFGCCCGAKLPGQRDEQARWLVEHAMHEVNS